MSVSLEVSGCTEIMSYRHGPKSTLPSRCSSRHVILERVCKTVCLTKAPHITSSSKWARAHNSSAPQTAPAPTLARPWCCHGCLLPHPHRHPSPHPGPPNASATALEDPFFRFACIARLRTLGSIAAHGLHRHTVVCQCVKSLQAPAPPTGLQAMQWARNVQLRAWPPAGRSARGSAGGAGSESATRA